ncbi:hypothetical protein NE237_023273 [Protea cynaroides]|uniref:Uncharacterized protein n=1 Tax=Protea cynaroides TaxID=273540 RepID=A0A9Q0K4A9_9MAGN|nr:hypothetical protein NE237_023273 [Protea cynaroides]
MYKEGVSQEGKLLLTRIASEDYGLDYSLKLRVIVGARAGCRSEVCRTIYLPSYLSSINSYRIRINRKIRNHSGICYPSMVRCPPRSPSSTLQITLINLIHNTSLPFMWSVSLLVQSLRWTAGERMRRAILEKVGANQLQTLSFAEERILQKLRVKEAEVEDINRKNMELEERMRQLSVEAGAWQQRAKSNENIVTTLKFNLQKVLVQGRDSKEGCGDSEIDDTASCCNGGAIDFNLVSKENKDLKELMTCKVCRVNEDTRE